MVIRAVGEEEIMMIGSFALGFLALFGSAISSRQRGELPIACDG